MKKKKLSGQEVEDLKRKWLDHVPQGLIDEIVEEINIPDSFEKAVASGKIKVDTHKSGCLLLLYLVK